MDSERLNLGETEEPEMLELEKVRGDDPNFTDSENKPLIAIPKDSEVIEEVSDNPDSEPPATKILFVDKDMDKEYDKIVDIFKKQSRGKRTPSWADWGGGILARRRVGIHADGRGLCATNNTLLW